MKQSSLRLKLLVVATATILATLAVAGWTLSSLFEEQIEQRIAQELEGHWTELATAFTLDAKGAPTLTYQLTDPRYRQPYSGQYWQITENGHTVLTSRSLWDEVLDTNARVGYRSGDGPFEISGPDQSVLYVVDREVILGGSRVFHLTVASDHSEVDAARQEFERDILRLLGSIALVLVLGAWLQLRLSLSPLRALDRELNAVHDGRRARLGDNFPKEVQPVVADLNRLLDRQDQLVRKARDRAGALAHGLKTPLTVVAAEARRLDRLGMHEAAVKIDNQLELIRNHVDRELARARTCGAAAAAGAFTAVDETVRRLFRLMQFLPRGESILWESEIPSDLILRMEPDDFGEVVGNLLDNARKWAKSRVNVIAEPAGDHTRVVIEDDGPGFPAGRADSMLERGMSGVPGGQSSGLGLAMVRDILAEYGIGLEVGSDNGWCRVSFLIASSGLGSGRKAAPPTTRPVAAEAEAAATP